MWGAKTWFSSRDRNQVGFGVEASIIDMTSVWASELIWILRGRREILGFSVWIKSNSVFCGGIEVDLI